MSSIADFRIIATNKLSELEEASKISVKKGLFKKTIVDNYWEFLNLNTEKLEEFNWS